MFGVKGGKYRLGNLVTQKIEKKIQQLQIKCWERNIKEVAEIKENNEYERHH